MQYNLTYDVTIFFNENLLSDRSESGLEMAVV